MKGNLLLSCFFFLSIHSFYFGLFDCFVNVCIYCICICNIYFFNIISVYGIMYTIQYVVYWMLFDFSIIILDSGTQYHADGNGVFERMPIFNLQTLFLHCHLSFIKHSSNKNNIKINTKKQYQ